MEQWRYPRCCYPSCQCRTRLEYPVWRPTIIWFGLTWSLELYQQTNARLWRQGQQSTVVIHHIIAKDTIDEDVMKALRKKRKSNRLFIDSVKSQNWRCCPLTDPYENLANSIVLLAVKDYRDALKKLKKWPRNESAKIMKDEVERFFRSAWYRELTSVDGEYLISKLQAEVDEP